MVRLLLYGSILILSILSAWTSVELIGNHQRDRGWFHLIVTLVLLIGAIRLWLNRNRPGTRSDRKGRLYLLFYFIAALMFTSIDWAFDNGFPGKAWEHLLFAALLVTAGYEQWREKLAAEQNTDLAKE
jgi:peptidoglycan/LPS O-acetylase OafA/YrhL